MAKLAYPILIALVVTCASAQAQQAQAQQQGGRSAAQIMSSIPANSETVTHWYKQNVYDPNDSKIGEIMDVLVDRDGKVTAFIPDPCPYPYAGVSTLAEGVTSDIQGNVYGADFLMNVRKFVKK